MNLTGNWRIGEWNMKNRKRKMILVVTLAVILLTGIIYSVYVFRIGFNSRVATTEKFYNTGQVNGFGSDDGFYHTNSTGFLYFFDFNTKKDVIVCNKPNCAHKAWYENTPDEQRCNAYTGMSYGFVLENSLYIFCGDYSTQTISIVKSGLDRTGYAEIVQMEGIIVFPFVVKDQFLYMTGSIGFNEKDEDGMESPTGEFESWIYRVDLRTGTTATLTDRIRHFNGGLFIAGASGDYIYCKDDYFTYKYDGTNYLDAMKRTDWYSYKISTGQFEPVFNDQSFEGVYIHNNKLVGVSGASLPKSDIPYEFEQYQITVLDLVSGENISILDANVFLCCVDGKVFYSVGEKNSQIYYCYDIDQMKTIEMSRTFMESIYVRESIGDYLYVLVENPDTLDSSPCLILKSDFYREKESYIPLVWKEA
jgi:hypothetical protein